MELARSSTRQLHVDPAGARTATPTGWPTRPWTRRPRSRRCGRHATDSGDAASPPGWTGASGAPTRLLLLRHGQTELSVERRYSGRGNPALTELGRRQADAAARVSRRKRGGIAAVVSSPLQRAHDTAAAAAKALGLDVIVDDDLIETDFGDWEGLTFGEAARTRPELHRRWLRDTSVPPPGGESFDAVARPGAAGAGADHRRARRRDRAGGVARDADQDAAADGARRRAQASCTGCTWTWRRCRSPSSTPTALHRCGWSTRRPICDSALCARAARSPCGAEQPIASTGPSTTPNQCGVHVENSTASPGSMMKSRSPRISRKRPDSTYIQS